MHTCPFFILRLDLAEEKHPVADSAPTGEKRSGPVLCTTPAGEKSSGPLLHVALAEQATTLVFGPLDPPAKHVEHG
jgi:hypothetical protein